jgi:hypothetical protein
MSESRWTVEPYDPDDDSLWDESHHEQSDEDPPDLLTQE